MTILQRDDDRTMPRTPALGVVAGVITILLGIVAALLPIIEFGRAQVVGWLLLAAGGAEVLFAYSRERWTRITCLISGLVTAIAGMIIAINPSEHYFPVANLVMFWLLVRGAWVIGRSTLADHSWSTWMTASGAVDLFLGLLLASGLPVALLVVTLFGPTPLVIAKFSLILATSLLLTGIAELTSTPRSSR